MPNRMIDENKNLVESSGRLLDESKNLVQVHGYAIDENKNLIESDGIFINAQLTSVLWIKNLNATFRNNTNKRLDAEDFVPLFFYSLVQCDPSSYASFRVRQITGGTTSVRYLVYVLNDANTKRIKAYEYTLNTSGTGQVSADYVGEWEQGIRLMYPNIYNTDGLVTIIPSSLYPDETPDKILYRLTDTEDWIEYTAPFTVEESCRIDTYVEKEGYQESITVSAQIEIFVAPTEWVAIDSVIASYPNADIRDITYGNDKFVAINTVEYRSYSTDGITWTHNGQFDFRSTEGILAYGNNIFIAPINNDYDGVWYSTDGISWVRKSPSKILNPSAIAFYKDKFIMGGYQGKACYSADGTSWTAISSTKLSEYIYGIACSDELVVMCDENGYVSYSTDGITWTGSYSTGRTSGNSEVGNNNKLTYGNEKFIIAGVEGASYSTDGITWTAIEDVKVSTPRCVKYVNNIFIIGGDGGQASYSKDGITWTAIEDTKMDGIYTICYGDGKIIMAGENQKGSYCIC